MKISIIVPIYNVEEYLQRCVDSLICQTYRDIEIILVNDGSTDNSLEICKSNAKKDSRIIILDKTNGGLSDARNSGLKISTGDFILFVDSDDYIEHDSCEKLISGMKDDVDFVAGAYKEIAGNKYDIKRHTNLLNNTVYTSRDFVIQSIKNNEWYAPAWLNLYRKSFLLKNNLYFKYGIIFEDKQIMPRLFLCAKKIVYIDYPFYNYIIRKNSIMTSDENMSKKRQMAISIYNEWLECFDNIEDIEYKKYLYGILIRFYLQSCASLKNAVWNLKNHDLKFAVKYALNLKEKMKVLFFYICPSMYITLYNNIKIHR